MLVTPARTVLLMAFLVLLFNSGARFAMGLMLHPMSMDLGWSRTTLSSTVTVYLILSASALPFAGQLVDRFGARYVITAGVLVSGTAITLMGFIEAPIHALLLYGVVFAIGSAAISITPIGVILTRWYPNRVGMANSIAISGMGVGQLLIISVLTSQLVSMGWRGSFIILGAATVLLVLPIVLVAGRSQPPDELNDRDESSGHSNVPGNKGSYSSLPQALRSTKLWILLLVYAICGFQDFLVATHVVAFALDEGISAMIAGNMLAFMGLAGLAGVLITGLLNDRYGPVLPTALCFVIRIAIFCAILFSQTPAVIVGAALLYGTTFWITAPLTVVFARRLCNFALLGTLSGLITMVHHFAGGLGAFSGGWVFETSGTYEPAFQALLVMSVVALLLTWPLRKHHPV
jgi:MFS family permease